MDQDLWIEIWQQDTKQKVFTLVEVLKIRSLKENHIFEIAKYSAKDSDYLQNQKVFEVFYKALKVKRLIVFSFLFKEAMTKLKNGDHKSTRLNYSQDYISYAVFCFTKQI